MNRRHFLGTALAAVALDRSVRAKEPAGETLYNGIRLPAAVAAAADGTPRDAGAAAVPRQSPPAVIPIDVGRQLFVDDFLIEQTTLTRTFHRAEAARRQPGPPARQAAGRRRAGRRWRWSSATASGTTRRTGSSRCGTWAATARPPAYATSEGRHPVGQAGARREARAPTSSSPTPRDSATVWLDLDETDPKRRYKLFRSALRGRAGSACRSTSRPTASTGASASCAPARPATAPRSSTTRSARCGSTASATAGAQPRRRRYWETPDLLTGPAVGADRRAAAVGRRRPARPAARRPEGACRSSTTSTASPTRACCWACSPSGAATRTSRRAGRSRTRCASASAATASTGTGPTAGRSSPSPRRPGDWNWGNVQSAGGCCLVVGDELYFYHSGRAGIAGQGRDARRRRQHRPGGPAPRRLRLAGRRRRRAAR